MSIELKIFEVPGLLNSDSTRLLTCLLCSACTTWTVTGGWTWPRWRSSWPPSSRWWGTRRGRGRGRGRGRAPSSGPRTSSASWTSTMTAGWPGRSSSGRVSMTRSCSTCSHQTQSKLRNILSKTIFQYDRRISSKQVDILFRNLCVDIVSTSKLNHPLCCARLTFPLCDPTYIFSKT